MSGELIGKLEKSIESFLINMFSDKNEYRIQFKSNEIYIERKTSKKNNLCINFLGEKKDFVYEDNDFKYNFYVLGEDFSIDEKNNILFFSYKLYDSNENEINTIKMSIKHLK